jgi:CubicO group peptidase (beta-lactamase class C family)
MTTVSTGFTRVAEVFAHVQGLAGGGMAFAATVDGEEVVSLAAGLAAPGRPWTGDTPAVVMSVTKGWASMCVQLLADRGLVDVDAPMASYWPEFVANGKQAITVRQVMLHTAGVIGLPDAHGLLRWDGTGWTDLDGIADRLASSRPAWEPGARHGYHAVTFGWLVGELVRRVTGTTLGELFASDIAGPLGIRSAIGIDAERHRDVAVVDPTGIHTPPLLLRPLLGAVNKRMRLPHTLAGQAFLGDGTRSIMDAVAPLLASPDFLRAEVPSSNGVTSARDLARLAAVLANEGTVGGVRLLSPEIVHAWSQPQLRAGDCVLAEAPWPVGKLLDRQLQLSRSLGYALNVPALGKPHFGPNPRAFGMEGAGGQVMFADPDRRVSVGFVRSALTISPRHGIDLVTALYADLDDQS